MTQEPDGSGNGLCETPDKISSYVSLERMNRVAARKCEVSHRFDEFNPAVNSNFLPAQSEVRGRLATRFFWCEAEI
jgi:hypothetical protein